jgi:hypothetical protein
LLEDDIRLILPRKPVTVYIIGILLEDALAKEIMRLREAKVYIIGILLEDELLAFRFSG